MQKNNNFVHRKIRKSANRAFLKWNTYRIHELGFVAVKTILTSI
jgi:hypothetical protein